MDDESVLRQKAREALQSGRLPNRTPDQMWGGPATGARCVLCGTTTRNGEVELEIEFAGGDAVPPMSYHVHLKCFSILDVERQKLSRVSLCGAGEPGSVVRGMARRAGGMDGS